MIGARNELHRRLFELANNQEGCFTAGQATSLGFSRESQHYHVKTGRWVRLHRGIYRLRDFPFSEYDQYMWLYLWTSDSRQNPQGVLSHQTALSLYDLSDIMPAKVHMTVPFKFRRSAPPPKLLVLHRADLKKEDTIKMQGFRVTSVLRTLLDMVKAQSISIDILVQGAQQAYQRGLVSKKEFQTNPGLHFLLQFMTL